MVSPVCTTSSVRAGVATGSDIGRGLWELSCIYLERIRSDSRTFSAQSAHPPGYLGSLFDHVLFQEHPMLHQQLAAHVDPLQVWLFGGKNQRGIGIEYCTK